MAGQLGFSTLASTNLVINNGGSAGAAGGPGGTVSPRCLKNIVCCSGGDFLAGGTSQGGQGRSNGGRADLVVARSFWYAIPLTLREQESLMSVAAGEGDSPEVTAEPVAVAVEAGATSFCLRPLI